MVRVGQHETFTEYLQSLKAQGTFHWQIVLKPQIDYLRLVIIVGGYILLRPLLVRYAARLQQKQLEVESQEVSKEGAEKEKAQENKAKKDLQWGAGARIRQRKATEKHIAATEESESEDLD